jgi:two-component system, NarL family, nitrate/nitrite response regulator NarL
MIPTLRPPTRVMAAARQPLLRSAIARAVRQRATFQLVAEVGDGSGALLAIERTTPDVAVVDVRLRHMDGRRVLNAIVRDGLPTRVILLSSAAACQAAYAALEAGAAGWLTDSGDEEELCTAIASVAAGEVALGRDAQCAVAAEIRRRATQTEPAVLDERERRVLVLVAAGRTATDIGYELGISAGSVKTCLLRLYRRLGVSERAAAVAVALRRGLIE